MREESAKAAGGDIANGRLLASARDLFAEAKKLMESGVQGCAQQASTQFTTILATIPKKADGSPMNQDFGTLDTECQKALKRAEQLDRAEKARLITLLKGSVGTHLAKGDLPSAWGEFGQLTRITAMTPEIEGLRIALENAEKKADAIKRMTEARAHFDRGSALLKEGKYNEASQEFRDVQVLIPGQELALQAGQQQKDCIIAAISGIVVRGRNIAPVLDFGPGFANGEEALVIGRNRTLGIDLGGAISAVGLDRVDVIRGHIADAGDCHVSIGKAENGPVVADRVAIADDVDPKTHRP
jgi:hypothetical protein